MNADTLKHAVEALLSPFGIAALLTASGLILGCVRRRSRLGPRLLSAGSLLFLLYVFTPLAEILVGRLEHSFPPLLHPDPSVRVERVVVLSGYGEDFPGFSAASNLSQETVCRLAEGIRLYRLIPGSKLLAAGGILRAGDRPVAALMADFLAEQGIPPEDVLVEPKSRTTWENFVELRGMIGPRPFVLVTSGTEMRRAVAVARKLDMAPIPAPACIWTLQHQPRDGSRGAGPAWWIAQLARPSPARLGRLQRAWHEYAGFVWYRLLGRV